MHSPALVAGIAGAVVDEAVRAAVRALPAMLPETLDTTRAIRDAVLARPQADLDIEHDFWAGIYARTVILPPFSMTTAVVMKIPAMLIVDGDAHVYNGGDVKDPAAWVHIKGRRIIKGAAGRMQVVWAVEETRWTMQFASKATTVQEAEAEFTDEVEWLTTRRPACPA